eukprot:Selendium_serpulae@DN6271_c1_g4_i2.p1
MTDAPANGSLASARVVKEEDAGVTKFLKLQTLTWVDPNGQQRLWNRCVRTGTGTGTHTAIPEPLLSVGVDPRQRLEFKKFGHPGILLLDDARAREASVRRRVGH